MRVTIKTIAAGCGVVVLGCLGVLALPIGWVVGAPPPTYGPLPKLQASLVLQNGMVFDGHEVHTGFDVVIDGETLLCVADTCPVPEGAQVWDASGMFVMPGLIDAHVHWLFAEHGLWSFNQGSPQTRRAYLEAGVTTVRSLGDTPSRVEQQQGGAAIGFAGPRFIAAGPLFTAPGGHPMNHWDGAGEYLTNAAIEIDDADSAQRHAERLLDSVSDGIKVVFDDGDASIGSLPRVEPDVLRRLVEVAHARGAWIAVHAQDDSEVRLAAQLGVDTIEHGFIWDEPTPETLDTLVASGAVVVPTLSAFEHIEKQFDLASLTAVNAQLPRRVLALYKRGVPIGVGSDNQPGMVQGAATLNEMKRLHQAGIPTLDVLRGATSVNAAALKREDLGVLRAGARSDVLVLSQSPVLDLSALDDPLIVLANGAFAVDRR